MTTKRELAEIKEIGVLEYIASVEGKLEKDFINGDIMELYEDEEVNRLINHLKQLESEVKSIKSTLKKVDEVAMDALSRRGIKKAENNFMKIALVEQTRYSIDDQKLETFLSKYGKSKTEFQKSKEIKFLKKTMKKGD